MKKGFFHTLGESILPAKIRVHLKKYILKTGSYNVPYGAYGKLFVLTIFLTIAIYAVFLFNIVSKTGIPLFILSTFTLLSVIELTLVFFAALFVWLYYEFRIFRRMAMIEEVLPDFLQEVSINLRAGMSFDNALWNSVGPEFGILEKEIEMVAKKVMGGEDTEKALKEFADRYNSTLLHESMDMIIIGLKSGGNVAELIDKIVENVKEAYFLRRELIASVTSYIIFIGITAVVISPTLFALSFNLMEIIQGLGEKLITTSSYSVLPFNMGYKSINPADFIMFSKISIIIISLVSAMIIAELREGSIKAGFKYIFVFIPVSYLIYVAMLGIFTSIFGVLA